MNQTDKRNIYEAIQHIASKFLKESEICKMESMHLLPISFSLKSMSKTTLDVSSFSF